MRAENTTASQYFNRMMQGRIALPHYQRPSAWSRSMEGEFFRALVLNRPVGAILTYEIPADDPLDMRALDGAQDLNHPDKYLLDGQQRLTSLLKGFTNDFERDGCRYFLILGGDEPAVDYFPNNPNWLNDPAECFRRMRFPLNLMEPGNEQAVAIFADRLLDAGINANEVVRIQQRLLQIRATVANLVIPELILETDVPPDVALDVFVKMNTNNADLDPEDIAVAMVALQNVNLRNYFNDLAQNIPAIDNVVKIPWVVLATAALYNGWKPSAAEFRGEQMAQFLANDDNRARIREGLTRTGEVLRHVKVYDAKLLPTKTVVPLLATIWMRARYGAPDAGAAQNLNAARQAHVKSFMRKVFWRGVLSDRYDRQSNARAREDANAAYGIIDQVRTGNADIAALPLGRAALPNANAVATAGFPTRSSRLARAVFLVTIQRGARDPLDGQVFDVDLEHGLPDYHHFFPKKWAEALGIDRQMFDTAMNCVFLQALANREIQSRPPRDYITNCNANPPGWACQENAEGDHQLSQDRLNTIMNRLAEQLVPRDQALAEVPIPNGEVTRELRHQAEAALQAFLDRRAGLVLERANRLVNGENVDANG